MKRAVGLAIAFLVSVIIIPVAGAYAASLRRPLRSPRRHHDPAGPAVALRVHHRAQGAGGEPARFRKLHVHAGLTCVPKAGDAAKLTYNFSEGIRNISTSATATALCPVD